MLNRRLLRVKVLQALYAFQQSSEKDANKAERELFLSLERIYDLYIQLLLLPAEIAHLASVRLEESKTKNFPTEADRQLSNNFIENKLVLQLKELPVLNKVAEQRKISWSADRDVVSKLFKQIKETSAYNDYLFIKEPSLEEDHQFVMFMYKNIICKSELVQNLFQERSIYWSIDEFDYACTMIRNTLGKPSSKESIDLKLVPLFKDEEEDRDFIKKLFHETISNSSVSEKLISDKTKNWDLERIAVIDIIMMKMAITELMCFNSIPVKVTLNEYIEISKFFSSPKSKTFINGILDQIIPELQKTKQMNKTGRGLMK